MEFNVIQGQRAIYLIHFLFFQNIWKYLSLFLAEL